MKYINKTDIPQLIKESQLTIDTYTSYLNCIETITSYYNDSIVKMDEEKYPEHKFYFKNNKIIFTLIKSGPTFQYDLSEDLLKELSTFFDYIQPEYEGVDEKTQQQYFEIMMFGVITPAIFEVTGIQCTKLYKQFKINIAEVTEWFNK